MADKATWTGASGKKYEYHVWDISTRPNKEREEGNYIFAKVANAYWVPVYIGEGKLQQRYDAALDEGCVTDKHATHYHVHLESNQGTRKSEERDLIEGNSQCKWPNGCNGHD